MPTFGAINPPLQRFGRVRPRTGFPVQNMGGFPQTPTTAPPKPFVASPTVGPPPGPDQRVIPMPGGINPAAGVPPPPGPNARVPPAPGGINPAAGVPPGPGPVPRVPPVPGGINPGAPPPPIAPPAPAGTPPVPGAPTPAPVPSSPSPVAPSGQSGAPQPAGQWNLENQLQNYLSNAFNASVSPEFINRARQDVFRNVQGQTGQATRQINEDAIRRGLYRSGIPAESIANVQGQGQTAMARGIADVLNAAETQNIQGRQQAGSLATNLLGMNREQARYEQQRADEAAARAAAGAPRTFQYIDPDTGQVYEMDESWF